MSLFDFHYNVTPPPLQPTSWAVPIGVITAAAIAGLFSLISLIISKENKVTEFRQAWIDAQRDDVAEVLAAAVRLEVAPLEQRAEIISNFDRCCARIMLRDNPSRSPVRDVVFTHYIRWIKKEERKRSKRSWAFFKYVKKTNAALPWGKVSMDMLALREQLNRNIFDKEEILRLKISILARSRDLLKVEWTIVKEGERWYSLTRNLVRGLLAIIVIVVGVTCFSIGVTG